RFQSAIAARGEWASGAGAGNEKRDGLCSAVTQDAQHAADRACGRLQDIITAAEFVALEGGEVGGGTAEVVALGEDGTNGNARCAHGFSTYGGGGANADGPKAMSE